MSDIVERLRNRIIPDGWLELAEEAATDIERLRAALQQIAVEKMASNARRALEQKP